ncbi:MAG: hypothetical protein ACKVQJ_12850 [Pyrinomonadaceae bacterium]
MTIDPAALLPIRVLHDFARRMELLNIPYMLTGSMAMFQYSNYRMTSDIDFVLELLSHQSDAFIQYLEPDYYIPHGSMKRAINSKRMFNILNQENSFKIDCVMLKQTPFHINAFERRDSVDFYGKRISIIRLEDLIISKLLWAADSKSEKQLADIKNLMRNPFDETYIETWTIKLGLEEAYRQCRSEIEK